jgi:hypothetical protein
MLARSTPSSTTPSAATTSIARSREIADNAGERTTPFDRDEARAFDAAVPRETQPMSETDATYVSGFEETDLPPRKPPSTIDSSPYDAVHDDALNISGSYDPYGTEAVQTPPSFADPTAANAVSSSFGPADHGHPRGLEHRRDLDEAEFYAGQGMYPEAIDVLNGLRERFPGTACCSRSCARSGRSPPARDPIRPVSRVDPRPRRQADTLNLDEIEEMGVEDLVELDANSQPIQAPRKRQPTVMLEKPVDEGDVDTHYDLGLAYKEMALYDDAIKAFEQALRAPGREVGCRVMIGMCLREQGNPSEAIHQFKQGLHAEPTERERQSLYYEIGITYDAIGDPSEALYFFEMVLKRDPSFADAALRADRLRAGGGRAMHAHDDDI